MLRLMSEQTHKSVFFEEIVEDPDICDNCYLPTHERISLSGVFARGNVPDELRQRREDTTEVDSHGLFCDCGSDTSAQIRPRNREMRKRHIENVYVYLDAQGYSLDRRELMRAVRRRCVEDSRSDEEEAINEAVEYALER